jgi:hypothetical protein
MRKVCKQKIRKRGLWDGKLKVPTQFQILKRKHHSKALRRSEKMHPARLSRP